MSGTLENLATGAMPTASISPGEILDDLAKLIHANTNSPTVLQAVVDAGRGLVRGAGHASLVLADRNGFRIVAASSMVARRIGSSEIELGQGPILEAILGETVAYAPDLAAGSRWPDLTKIVVSETNVQAAVCYPLVSSRNRFGSLCFFGDNAQALTPDSREWGAVMAAFASVALATVDARSDAESVREDLRSNRDIGKAMGLLMSRHRINADDALTTLRTLSQQHRIKLSELAQRVAAEEERRQGRPRRR